MQRGWITELIYEGTADAIRAAELSLYPHVSDFEADYTDPPKARLTIRTPDPGDGTRPANGILSTTFELVGNATGKSIYEHKKSQALGTDILNAIKTDFDNRVLQASSAVYAAGGDQRSMRDMLIKGQDTFLLGQFVFKIINIIDSLSDIDIAYAHSNQVYSSAKLIAEANPTPLYVKGINAAYNSILNDFYGGAAPANHTLGWLKNPPDISNIGGNRQAVTVQYWLEAWRTDFTYATNL